MYKTCCKIGKKPVIESGVRISRAHKISTGKVIIGDYATIGRNAHIDATGTVEIGNFLTLSENAAIYSHSHPTLKGWAMQKPKPTDTHTVRIGDCVTIYANAIILPTVSNIGNNAIIAAGSVVTHDVPDNVVVAGNPARVIKEITE